MSRDPATGKFTFGRLEIKQRILDSIEPDLNSGCWLWRLNACDRGYGRMQLNGKTVTAHRTSYFAHKEGDRSLFVLHRCDTPSCVNPDHLFLGTAQDNVNDMIAKGRKKVRKGRAPKRLSASAVREIRQSPDHASVLASRHSVGVRTIRDIQENKTWKNLP